MTVFLFDLINPTVLSNNGCVPFHMFDVIYCTRMQNERKETKLGSADIVINDRVMKKVKEKAIIMHPLPRNNEINPEVDNDPRCVYFEQVKNGVKIRMALLDLLLE